MQGFYLRVSKNKTLLLTVSVILLSAAFNSFGQTKKSAVRKTSSAATQAEREKIEKIVREYILKNPSIIREATAALAAQEEKEKSERAAQNLKTYRKEIFSDAATPSAGNARGDVTIAVFFDYNCGYCRRSLPGLNDILKKDSAVRVVYKEFPILGTPSLVAAKAALAANLQGKYLEFHNALLESDEINDDTIKAIAGKLNLNYAKLQRDMESKTVAEEIQKTYQLTTSLEINGTPAYIVGERLLPGAVDAEGLIKIIAAERAAARK